MLFFIIFFSLNLSKTQSLIRKSEEPDKLSFCFDIDLPEQNNNQDIQIFCSGNECYGIINNNENIFTNVTVLCNTISGKIKNKPSSSEGNCDIEEKCENCIEIILICYKNRCIGGPSPNNSQNNNNNNNENNNNNNGNNNNENNNNNDDGNNN